MNSINMIINICAPYSDVLNYIWNKGLLRDLTQPFLLFSPLGCMLSRVYYFFNLCVISVYSIVSQKLQVFKCLLGFTWVNSIACERGVLGQTSVGSHGNLVFYDFFLVCGMA